MGVECSAKIVVGLPVWEFEDWGQIEEFGLDVVAPYYDGSKGIAGVVVSSSGDYSRMEIDLHELAWNIEAAKSDFLKITGRFGIVYLSTCGY